MMDENFLEMVEAYINNNLSEDERKAFEARLQSDVQFREEVKPLLAHELALKLEVEKERRQRFDTWFEEAREDGVEALPPTRSIRPLWIAIGMAAAIALLLFAFWPRPKQADPQQLFAQNFQPYFPPEVRGETHLDSLTKAAHVLLLQGDYQEAIPLMKELLSQTDEEEERMYLASAYLATNQPELALELLAPLPSETNAVVNWYAAMAYLKLGQKEAAIPLLERLAAKKVPFYGPKAKAILEN